MDRFLKMSAYNIVRAILEKRGYQSLSKNT